MKGFVDLHCDSLYYSYFADPPYSFEKDERFHVDLFRLKEGGVLVQFFAIFLPTPQIFREAGLEVSEDEVYIDHLMSYMQEMLKKHSDDFAFASSIQEVEANRAAGKISAFLTMEDGRAIQGSFDRLREYYDRGVRLITLTWNGENCFGFPNSDKKAEMERGLKSFGKEAIEAMNELGIIIDVSHLSDGGFWDVAELSQKPFVASHSNARELCSHRRNLSDEMIRAVAEKGGVIGVNFNPGFLRKQAEGEWRSEVKEIVAHLNYLKNKGGEDVLALGSDFDGIGGELEIDGPDRFPYLAESLLNEGWAARQIEKFASQNALRVIADVL